MIQKKVMAIWFLMAMVALFAGAKSAQAQDSPSKAEQPEKAIHAYRLDFSLNEFAGEKKINTRHYSITSDVPGERQEIKIGTRVPVATASIPTSASAGSGSNSVVSTEYQYLDVGTHIWCSLKEHGDELELQAGSDISNIDAEGARDTNNQLGPVVRQIKIIGSTIVVLGKAIIIGSADDPASNRQFQLEVTVSKLR